MILNALKLSHFAVSACTIILVLMVMHFDSAGSNSIRLFHDKSRGYLTVFRDGTVRTITSNKDIFQNLVMTGDKDFIITLYNEATRRYLCFNKAGKLVAKKRPKVCSMCKFREQMINGFHRFESVHHFGKLRGGRKLIAFTNKGEPSKNNTFPLFVKKDMSHRANSHKTRHHNRMRNAKRHC